MVALHMGQAYPTYSSLQVTTFHIIINVIIIIIVIIVIIIIKMYL